MNIERIAAKLRHLYQTAVDTDGYKSKARAIAFARFLGAVDLVHAVGLGRTPAAVEMVVLDTFLALEREWGARPAYEPSSNAAQKRWDAEIIDRIAAELRHL